MRSVLRCAISGGVWRGRCRGSHGSAIRWRELGSGAVPRPDRGIASVSGLFIDTGSQPQGDGRKIVFDGM